ncbi:hypothetical protein PRIPAC_94070 [Pristionchus pacificus]|uniref:SER_THR_PHOSPHATASE domain-containing protein n=1 Tax=Pristionchus pacificus TaxID=54126 RepID=A0A2A6BRC2_PRIPA|nr:hypothetical protein PRIPAC_94070 [Pristionchus pacificus]|eukprot:PDM68301.1 hypothetical protein PRIPAC_46345 [Pristionchus pacificus]
MNRSNNRSLNRYHHDEILYENYEDDYDLPLGICMRRGRMLIQQQGESKEKESGKFRRCGKRNPHSSRVDISLFRWPHPDPKSPLRKEKCYYCMRTVVLYMESVTKWKVIHEEAGCADEVDLEKTPPGLDCASHLGKNSSGRGSDFVMYFSARGDTELIGRRCCENFDGYCNRPFQIKYPQKYMLRHIKRSAPKLMGIFIFCILLIFYYIFRIYLASRSHRQMSLDVTKKEQMKMFGYKDDPLEATIIENMTKVEEPQEAVRKSGAIGTFNDVLRAIFDIQYVLNPKKYDIIWTQSLPKMKRDAQMRGLKAPSEVPPPRILPIPERNGLPFYEMKRNQTSRTAIFAEVIKHLTISYKFPKTQNRPVPSCLPDLLLKLIEHGPYEYPFKAAELFQLFDKGKDKFAQDLPVLQLKGNQIVIGDIRGRYVDLFRFFNSFGWPPQRSYLFLGGIIENEEDQSIECMALLAALKTTMPQYINIIRGVGETVPYVPGRRFPGVKGEVVGNALARLCNSLPVAAVINSRILCTHSGVTTHFKGKNRLNNIQRPFNIDDMTEAGRRIIFAVPETNCRMFRMRPHEKNGEVFGSKAVQKTLANMKLDLLIRSRSQINDGYCLHWDNSVLSIWSALTHGVKKAAAVEIDPACRIALHLMDTATTLIRDKKQRVNTNNVKAAAEGDMKEEDIDDEDEEGDEDFVGDGGEKESSSRRKVIDEKPKSKDESARKASFEDDNKPTEITASGKSGGEAKKESGGLSREKTTMKDSRESKEANTMIEVEKEGLNKTQDSLSARAHEAAFSDSMMEQKTQSVKEWKGSNKKGKKKGEEKEKEKDKVIEKTPDISLRSEKDGTSMLQVATPTKDDGKKKKEEEKELNDAILKSKYEDAIPLKTNKEHKKKDEQAESMMKDISVRRKEGADKDVKHPIDSLRDGTKVDEKTKIEKKKSNETMNEGPSRETEKEAHPKEEYAISEKSMGSKTHKAAKKVKKEDNKEKKEEKDEKKEKNEEKEEKKEKREDKEEKKEKNEDKEDKKMDGK